MPEVGPNLQSGANDEPIDRRRGNVGGEQHAVGCTRRAVCEAKLKDPVGGHAGVDDHRRIDSGVLRHNNRLTKESDDGVPLEGVRIRSEIETDHAASGAGNIQPRLAGSRRKRWLQELS